MSLCKMKINWKLKKYKIHFIRMHTVNLNRTGFALIITQLNKLIIKKFKLIMQLCYFIDEKILIKVYIFINNIFFIFIKFNIFNFF